MKEDSGDWLLHACDAYFYRGEIGAETCEGTPDLRGYQALMEVDRRARLTNQAELRRLSIDQAGEVRIFCTMMLWSSSS